MLPWAHRHWLRMLATLRLELRPGSTWIMTALKVFLVALAVIVPGGTLLLLAVAAITALRSGPRGRLVASFARLRRGRQ